MTIQLSSIVKSIRVHKVLCCLAGLFLILTSGWFLISRQPVSADQTETKEYEAAPLTIVIDMDTQKEIELQVFYLHKSGQFSEKESVRQMISPNIGHVEIPLPVDKIMGLRIDIGSDPGKVIIRNIEVKAEQFINFNQWDKWKYVNIDSHKTGGENVLVLESDSHDPYMIFQPKITLNENTDFKVFLRQQQQLEQAWHGIPESTTARIEIIGRHHKKQAPYAVYVSDSDTSQSQSVEGDQIRTVIEHTGSELTFDLDILTAGTVEVRLSQPANATDPYIKYTLFTADTTTLINEQVPVFVSDRYPFVELYQFAHPQRIHYRVQWQRVYSNTSQE